MIENEIFYREILCGISSGVIYVQKGKILYVNPAATEILGKNDYVGMDFVGVRASESLARSMYEEENYGKKQNSF